MVSMKSDTMSIETIQSKASKPGGLLGIRHLQTLLMSTAVLLAYTLRVNLSVAIVAMVDKDNADTDFPVYDWDSGIQSIILSSFFWGYVITQIPAGVMLNIFGAKVLLMVCVLGPSIFTLLTPIGAEWGDWELVVAFRVISGLCQGFLFPSVHTLVSKWSPVEERGFLSTAAYAGAQLGTVIAMPICGVLASGSAGWPSAFYVFGAIGLVWCVFWFFLGSNTPFDDKLISIEERQYIEDSIGDTTDLKTKRATPLKAILTSVPFWAIVAANCGHGWGFWTLLTEMPSFMDGVLGFTLSKNGTLSALPYLAMFCLSFVFSAISSLLQRKKVISLLHSRKLFNSIGLWGPAAALIGVAFATDSTVAVALLTVAVGVNAGIYMGFNLSHIDIAPNYAGTLMGITNGFGNLMSIIGPLTVGVIVTDKGDRSQWQIVFFIASGIYLVTNLIFVLFAQTEVQSWNNYEEKPKKDDASVERY